MVPSRNGLVAGLHAKNLPGRVYSDEERGSKPAMQATMLSRESGVKRPVLGQSIRTQFGSALAASPRSDGSTFWWVRLSFGEEMVLPESAIDTGHFLTFSSNEDWHRQMCFSADIADDFF
jgi:hypothetical protein